MQLPKLIIYQNIPCWFEISCDDSGDIPHLILRIHKEIINSKEASLQKSPIVRDFLDKLKLPEFKEDFSKEIGFGGAFKFIREVDELAEFSVEIPQVKTKTNNKCKDCKGTGKRGERFGYDECLFCEGTGYKYAMNWNDVTAISASITVIMMWLQYPDIDTTAKNSQLLTLQTITQNGMHGGSLSGDISIPMKRILESYLGEVKFTEIIDAMKVCYDRMGLLRDYDQYSFNAYINKGRFVINIPGDACGLHPSDWYDHKEQGYEFSCHNVDSSIQQLLLIFGLAKLHDIVRDRGG